MLTPVRRSGLAGSVLKSLETPGDPMHAAIRARRPAILLDRLARFEGLID